MAFSLQHELDSILRLLHAYADVPMSLAEACLVRMSELVSDAAVLALDSDFRLYRRHRRRRIPLIMPATL